MNNGKWHTPYKQSTRLRHQAGWFVISGDAYYSATAAASGQVAFSQQAAFFSQGFSQVALSHALAQGFSQVAAFSQAAFFSQVAAFGHSAFGQHAGFWQHESGFWHSVGQAAFSHSAFWQHSVAGLSQQLSCLQAAFLQQPIAATAMAAISKIFFITRKKILKLNFSFLNI